MTAQIQDQFLYNGVSSTIVEASEALRFHPAQYGVMPQAIDTGCINGYWCVYNVTDGGIFLDKLYIHARDEQYPRINGVAPCSLQESYMGYRLYQGLHIKIPYTGKILTGDDFLQGYYMHLGFQMPWAYGVLTELVFESGNLLQVNDHSSIGAEIRRRLQEDPGFEERLYRAWFSFDKRGPAPDPDLRVWWLSEDSVADEETTGVRAKP